MITSDLQRLIDDAPDVDGTGAPIDLPPCSVVDLTDDDGDGVCLKLTKRVWLRGNGSVLNVPAGKVGIDCGDVQWPEIERLTLRGPPVPFSPGTIGIDLSHGARLTQVRMFNLETAMRAMCIRPDGTSRNVNCPIMEKVVVMWCGAALLLKGGDANQWSLVGAEIGECIRGIDDGGFLGGYAANVLFQDCPPPNADPTGCTVRISEPANFSTFVACYVEDGQNPMQDASQNTLRIGGTFVSQPGGEAVGCGYSHLRFRQPGGRVMVHVPSADLDGVIDWQHDAESAAWYFKRADLGAASGTFYALSWANLGSVWPLSFTAERSDTSQLGQFTIRPTA